MTDPTRAAQDRASREALLAAKQALIQDTQKQQEDAGASSPAASRLAFPLGLSVVALALVALLVMRPAWLFPPELTEGPEVQDASLRVRIYVEVDHLERFRQSMGRLPKSLLESGGDTTGLQYVQDGQSYSITGQNAGRSLTYSSNTSAAAFLGNAYELIRKRSQE